MGRVNVYYFKRGDITTGTTVRSKRPSTLNTIRLCGGEALLETVQEVDECALDDDGFLRRDRAQPSA